MSREIGRRALNLQWAPRVAHTEYMDNWEIVRHITGKDPRRDPSAWRDFDRIAGIDFHWRTNDGPVPWNKRGRTTDMGHATYVEDGSDYRRPGRSPFRTADEVLEFDAVKEYGLPDFGELVAYYEAWHRKAQEGVDAVVPGGYYKTLISGAIEAFGWERLLEAAGQDPDRFGDAVLGSFFELSLHHFRAWAETSIEFFMCHDDMVWTQGPFMHPRYYRKYVFPRYRELWAVLKKKGKRVLYTSDGTFDMFLDDLAGAGTDGFCFEPTNDLKKMVGKFGVTHVLMGGADCRTLTFGSKADIERELRGIFDLARGCPGFVFAAGNHFPANVPLENGLFYFELVAKLSGRG
ncbi:MAG: uroporphyrinogen decarboxylase family protein [Planctomycetota bacterium]|nr:uroporphyrinogen decarboxylase family protein [Planctomycetota bacterium]